MLVPLKFNYELNFGSYMPTVCVQLAAAFLRLRGPCVTGVCRSTRGFSVADSADLFQVRTEVVCHHAYDCRSDV